MIAITFQVIEMIKVYKPISEQAQATKDNMVADHRAWIGVIGATIDQPAIDKPIHARVTYNNTGRQPAPTYLRFSPVVFPIDEWNNGKAFSALNDVRDKCFSVEDVTGPPNITAFPTAAGGGYTYDATFTDANGNSMVKVDQDVVSGHKVVALIGCMVYRSYDVVRHTSYCGFDLVGKNVSTNLGYCVAGNDAN